MSLFDCLSSSVVSKKVFKVVSRQSQTGCSCVERFPKKEGVSQLICCTQYLFFNLTEQRYLWVIVTHGFLQFLQHYVL